MRDSSNNHGKRAERQDDRRPRHRYLQGGGAGGRVTADGQLEVVGIGTHPSRGLKKAWW
ncbi:hypothetical protein ACPA9J_29035 [Pseudomonas aeruginosa]